MHALPDRFRPRRGRVIAGQDRELNLQILDELCETMEEGSLCAMGGLTPMPVRSALRHFPEDFR
jgi:formate dehydrogenase iron-sulfur subunit